STSPTASARGAGERAASLGTGVSYAASTGTETGTDLAMCGTETGTETGADLPMWPGTETGIDTGVDTGSEMALGIGEETGRDTGSRTGMATVADAGPGGGSYRIVGNGMCPAPAVPLPTRIPCKCALTTPNNSAE